MPATPSQFSALTQAFNNAQATAIVNYVDALLQPQIANVVTLSSQLNSLQVPASIATPIRTLDTDFIISATRDALAFYSVQLTVQGSSLISASHIDITLLVNGQSVGNPLSDLVSVLGLVTSLTPTANNQICGYVPAGSTVRLASNTTGSGASGSLLTIGQEVLL